MFKKHATIQQLDGTTEEVLPELETEHDDEIEHYLSTGEIRETDPQVWEDILYYLGSNTQDIISLDSKINREEKFLALEARKQAIDRKYGPGEYLEHIPWRYSAKILEEIFK